MFIEEGVTLRIFNPPEPDQPKRGDYIALPDKPLVINPDERWSSYIVYPFDKR